MAPRRVQSTIRLEPELHEWLNQYVGSEGTTRNKLITKMLEDLRKKDQSRRQPVVEER